MDYMELIYAIIGVISGGSIMTIITWGATKRRAIAEAKGVEVDNTVKITSSYSTLIDSLNKRIDTLEANINNMNLKIAELEYMNTNKNLIIAKSINCGVKNGAICPVAKANEEFYEKKNKCNAKRGTEN